MRGGFIGLAFQSIRVISRDIALLLALALTIEQFVTTITAMARHNGYTTNRARDRKGGTL